MTFGSYEYLVAEGAEVNARNDTMCLLPDT